MAASESREADEIHYSRDITKRAGSPIYVVEHKRTHKLLGIDCPDWIFAKVMVDAEASAQKRQHMIQVKDKRERKASQALILRLFPHIPTSSLTKILDHGFEKGSRRVGRTKTLDEVVKAKLAVNAHIRHDHTNYDSIYSTARANKKGEEDIKAYARAAVYAQVRQIAHSWQTGPADAREADLGSIAQSSGPVPGIDVAVLGSLEEAPATHPKKASAIPEDIEDATKQTVATETWGCVKNSRSSTLTSGSTHRPTKSGRIARQVAT